MTTYTMPGYPETPCVILENHGDLLKIRDLKDEVTLWVRPEWVCC